MGMTGKAAIMWKLRYIEAFNAMEQALHENILRESRTSGMEGVKTACQQVRIEAARLVWSLGPKRKRRLRAMLRYRGMGLGIHSIAKLLGCHKREVCQLLKAADALGWLAPAASRPVQGNLLELEARHA